jgi:hypothetical protein
MKALREFRFPGLDRMLLVSLLVLLVAFLVVLLVEPGAVGRGGR